MHAGGQGGGVGSPVQRSSPTPPRKTYLQGRLAGAAWQLATSQGALGSFVTAGSPHHRGSTKKNGGGTLMNVLFKVFLLSEGGREP